MPANCVLVLETENDLHDAEAALHMRGFSVVRANDGREALELVAARSSSVLLLGAGMPVMSGWEVIHALSSNITLRNIPIIAVAGSHDLPSEVVRIPKPLRVDRLVDEVQRVIRPDLPQ